MFNMKITSMFFFLCLLTNWYSQQPSEGLLLKQWKGVSLTVIFTFFDITIVPFIRRHFCSLVRRYCLLTSHAMTRGKELHAGLASANRYLLRYCVTLLKGHVNGFKFPCCWIHLVLTNKDKHLVLLIIIVGFPKKICKMAKWIFLRLPDLVFWINIA